MSTSAMYESAPKFVQAIQYDRGPKSAQYPSLLAIVEFILGYRPAGPMDWMAAGIAPSASYGETGQICIVIPSPPGTEDMAHTLFLERGDWLCRDLETMRLFVKSPDKFEKLFIPRRRFELVDLLFTGEPNALTFVEAEGQGGESVRVGEWIEHGPYTALRIQAVI